MSPYFTFETDRTLDTYCKRSQTAVTFEFSVAAKWKLKLDFEEVSLSRCSEGDNMPRYNVTLTQEERDELVRVPTSQNCPKSVHY